MSTSHQSAVSRGFAAAVRLGASLRRRVRDPELMLAVFLFWLLVSLWIGDQSWCLIFLSVGHVSVCESHELIDVELFAYLVLVQCVQCTSDPQLRLVFILLVGFVQARVRSQGLLKQSVHFLDRRFGRFGDQDVANNCRRVFTWLCGDCELAGLMVQTRTVMNWLCVFVRDPRDADSGVVWLDRKQPSMLWSPCTMPVTFVRLPGDGHVDVGCRWSDHIVDVVGEFPDESLNLER